MLTRHWILWCFASILFSNTQDHQDDHSLLGNIALSVFPTSSSSHYRNCSQMKCNDSESGVKKRKKRENKERNGTSGVCLLWAEAGATLLLHSLHSSDPLLFTHWLLLLLMISWWDETADMRFTYIHTVFLWFHQNHRLFCPSLDKRLVCPIIRQEWIVFRKLHNFLILILRPNGGERK